MDTPKNKGGRPPKPAEEKLIPRTVLLTAAQWARVDANGWPWLRKLIDRAKPPK
jgi:hypothetical protein